ncbi:hypothetical protein Prudu_018073, partial [Prunus dulcis]
PNDTVLSQVIPKYKRKERNSPNATLKNTPPPNPKTPNPQPKSSNPNPQFPPNHLPPGSCRRELDYYFSNFQSSNYISMDIKKTNNTQIHQIISPRRIRTNPTTTGH